MLLFPFDFLTAFKNELDPRYGVRKDKLHHSEKYFKELPRPPQFKCSHWNSTKGLELERLIYLSPVSICVVSHATVSCVWVSVIAASSGCAFLRIAVAYRGVTPVTPCVYVCGCLSSDPNERKVVVMRKKKISSALNTLWMFCTLQSDKMFRTSRIAHDVEVK